jgi:arginase
MKRPVQILSAPSILGLKPGGVELLPESLLAAGLVGKIAALETVLEIPTFNDGYSYKRDRDTNCLNTALVRSFSALLMEKVAGQLDRSVYPLVLGGDCSILAGIMPGLKSKGNFALVFLDAHADFYQAEASPTGELADMDLAIVTGRGPEVLTNIGGLKPYVEDGNVVHIGQRDAAETAEYGSQDIAETAIKRFDLEYIRTTGIEQAGDQIVQHLETLPIDGFWIHWDTDVIDDAENPAVDYRLPGGLSFPEAAHLLKRLVETGKAAGMSVTIFNPLLDTTGSIAVKIVDCLAEALT